MNTLRLAQLSALGVLLTSVTSCGSPVARQVERAALNRLAKREAGSVAGYRALARRDATRDLLKKAERLQTSRTVYRYVSAQEAALIKVRGIPSARHFTASAAPGRPLAAASAEVRYGLPSPPSHRVAVELPAGTMVKTNKVLGGQAGVGELLVMQDVPRAWIRSIVPLR
jgi:hypothetical protein